LGRALDLTEMGKAAAVLQKHAWVALGEVARMSPAPALAALPRGLQGTKPAVCWGQHRNKLLFKMLWCCVLGDLFSVFTVINHA